MVDEALVGTLAEKVSPKDDNIDSWQRRLRILLDYNYAFDDNAEGLFSSAKKESIVRAIANLKVLDPAVGSGAFPMGILHKLTLVLRRLDPKNSVWERLQRENASQRATTAFDTDNQQERDAELDEISGTFEHYRDSDFGRKLYLIQNSIYSVDIQPIATQIAKLRFFISLAIEQEPSPDVTDNYGIKPLPNLETRFVTANTLRHLDKPRQMILQSEEINDLEQNLAANRERHFHANTHRTKQECRKHDVELRYQLTKKLQSIGLPTVSAGQISSWEPFEQNIAANWFDAEYMFGVKDGFDVVIGNPPYINVVNLPKETRNYLLRNYQTCEKRTDSYIAFLEKGLSLLNSTGILCYIIPSAFTNQTYATKMRQKLINSYHIRELVDASKYRIFENATVNNVVLSVSSNRKSDTLTKVRRYHSNDDFEHHTDDEFTIDQKFFASLKDARFDTNPPNILSLQIKEKVWTKSMRLDQICLVAYGARLNHRTKGKEFRKVYYLNPTYTVGAKQFCEGKNIKRYSFSQGGWLNYSPDEHYNPMFPELFENDKLICVNVVKDRLRFAYDRKGFYNSNTVINCVRMDLLVNAKHKTAVKAVKRTNISQSKQFDYRFLLAVLNSQFINWYFLNFLSEDLHFYPKDAMQLPIPSVSATKQRPVVQLVDRILQIKNTNSSVDTSEDESKIDQYVYEMYGLSNIEIAAVKNS